MPDLLKKSTPTAAARTGSPTLFTTPKKVSVSVSGDEPLSGEETLAARVKAAAAARKTAMGYNRYPPTGIH